MTDEQRLTLEELAGAVGMTIRNVRAYQTRGLLQPPRRAGRTSVYTGEHVERLRQVQRARARGASLQLLRTLIAEGRDLDGVWEGLAAPSAAPRSSTSPTRRSSTRRSARQHHDVPLDGVLTQLGGDGRRTPSGPPWLRSSDTGVFRRRSDAVLAPGAYGCAAGALHDQGVLDSAAAALRLTQLVADTAEALWRRSPARSAPWTPTPAGSWPAASASSPARSSPRSSAARVAAADSSSPR